MNREWFYLDMLSVMRFGNHSYDRSHPLLVAFA